KNTSRTRAGPSRKGRCLARDNCDTLRRRRMSTPRTETETAESLRSAAARARERGEAAESLRLYLEAAQRAEGAPTSARVKSSIDVELGELYERDLGRLDLAVERYERAYKENPDDARAVEAGRRLYR